MSKRTSKGERKGRGLLHYVLFGVLYLLLLTLFFSSWLPSQTKDSSEKTGSIYTLRVYEDLVIVDAVVTDRKGNPIRNLRPTDFTVYEDNVRQKIVTFDIEDLSNQLQASDGVSQPTQPSAGPPSPSRTPVAPLPREAFQNHRLIVLFLDLSSMPVEDLI